MKRVFASFLSMILLVSLCMPGILKAKAAEKETGTASVSEYDNKITGIAEINPSWGQPGSWYYGFKVTLTNNTNSIQVDKYKVTVTLSDNFTFPWGKPGYTTVSGKEVVIDYSATSNSIAPNGASKIVADSTIVVSASEQITPKVESVKIEIVGTSVVKSEHEYTTIDTVRNPVMSDDWEPGLSDEQATTYISWATVQFGNYPTDTNGGKAPIEWRVLNVTADNKLLLISDKVLDSMAYGYGDTTWDSSTIRNDWAENFITTAFDTDDQKKALMSYTVDNSEGGVKSSGGNNTLDKVWIPSKNDMLNQNYGFIGNDARRASVTDYAKAQNATLKCSTSSGINYAGYFLRTPGYYQYDVAGVDSYGKLISNGWRTYTKTAGIRPMILLDNTIANVTLYGQVNAKVAGRLSSLSANSLTKNTVKKLLAVGTTKTVNKVTYKVTKSSAKAKTVAVMSANKKAKKIVIPSTVTISGTTYKVTSIKANAFKKCKKIANIQIKSTNLQSINKKAFNGLDEKTTIKIVKSKYKKYKKLIKNKSVKIKKIS